MSQILEKSFVSLKALTRNNYLIPFNVELQHANTRQRVKSIVSHLLQHFVKFALQKQQTKALNALIAFGRSTRKKKSREKTLRRGAGLCICGIMQPIWINVIRDVLFTRFFFLVLFSLLHCSEIPFEIQQTKPNASIIL